MKNNRNNSIDFLRGLAVLLMILIHATAYFLNDKISRLIWDYSHFAVPLFVFCSAYIFFQKDKKEFFSLQYFLKRIKRLILPYYIFLLFYFLILIFISPNKISGDFIFSQIALGTNRDVGWLVVLFIYILILIPIVVRVSKHPLLGKILKKVIWLVPILLLFSPRVEYFRAIMWLPWMGFLTFVYWFVKEENKKWFPWSVVIVYSMGFIISRYILSANNFTLALVENKYPPNLYYLSYGIVMTTILYYLHRFLTKNNLFASWLQKGFDFLSIHSYSLFFIHFIYLYPIKGLVDYQRLGWSGFFGTILGLSIVSQIFINEIITIKRLRI